MYDGGVEESIYNIIPPKHVQPEKPPMHRSKHSPRMPPTASTFHGGGSTNPHVSNIGGAAFDKVVQDREARTLGKAPGSNKNTPREYIQKGSRQGIVPSLAEVKRCNPELLTPSTMKPRLRPGGIPSASDAPPMNMVSQKDFVVANAVEAILAAPKKGSNDAKDYLKKEDFGKVPKYLHHIKRDIDAEYEYIAALEQQQDDARRSMVRPMQEQERMQLIDGLKSKWEHVNTDFQAGTHLTKLDTIGKTKRKEHHEAQLGQIEKDIEKLNKKNIQVNNGY